MEGLDFKILVDADACPVKAELVRLARDRGIELVFFIDTSHILEDAYAKIVVVGQGSDSVDFALINQTQKGDIVVTQDYGLAAMALSKGARAIHPSGLIYSNDNMDRLLFERHINAKIRRAGGRHWGPGKRRAEDSINFEESLKILLDRQPE